MATEDKDWIGREYYQHDIRRGKVDDDHTSREGTISIITNLEHLSFPFQFANVVDVCDDRNRCWHGFILRVSFEIICSLWGRSIPGYVRNSGRGDQTEFATRLKILLQARTPAGRESFGLMGGQSFRIHAWSPGNPPPLPTHTQRHHMLLFLVRALRLTSVYTFANRFLQETWRALSKTTCTITTSGAGTRPFQRGSTFSHRQSTSPTIRFAQSL